MKVTKLVNVIVSQAFGKRSVLEKAARQIKSEADVDRTMHDILQAPHIDAPEASKQLHILVAKLLGRKRSAPLGHYLQEKLQKEESVDHFAGRLGAQAHYTDKAKTSRAAAVGVLPGLLLGGVAGGVMGLAALRGRHAKDRLKSLFSGSVNVSYLGESAAEQGIGQHKPDVLEGMQHLDGVGKDQLAKGNFSNAEVTFRTVVKELQSQVPDLSTKWDADTEMGRLQPITKDWHAEAVHQKGLAYHHLAVSQFAQGKQAQAQHSAEQAQELFLNLDTNHSKDLFPLTQNAVHYNLACSASVAGDAATSRSAIKNLLATSVKNLTEPGSNAADLKDLREDLEGTQYALVEKEPGTEEKNEYFDPDLSHFAQTYPQLTEACFAWCQSVMDDPGLAKNINQHQKDLAQLFE